jgi:threonine dehydratase
MALNAARSESVRSLLVSDAEIVVARQALWDHYRLAVEHGAGTAFAGLLSPAGYRPAGGEKVCVVLCGANTDPTDLTHVDTRHAQ